MEYCGFGQADTFEVKSRFVRLNLPFFGLGQLKKSRFVHLDSLQISFSEKKRRFCPLSVSAWPKSMWVTVVISYSKIH